MGVTPAEARKAEASRLKEELVPYVTEIDTMLCLGRRTYGITRVPAKITQLLKAHYALCGWTVEYICDQRDGDYLQFKG